MALILSPIEARVLGCLIEKEIATPDYYPLTLNALVAACNQKSNRAPTMALTDKDVVSALDAMRYDHKLAMQVTSTASRVPKYRHNLQSHWDFSIQERAILCELLLRGPQTVGELRTHTSRLHAFVDTTAVDETLTSLTEWGEGPLTVKLPREPGRRESRWAHLLCGDIEIDPQPSASPPEAARVALQAENDRISSLEAEVATLRETLDNIAREFSTFKKQFD
ncbi:MAG: YceH family protein [Kiritimatiellae bacterium]|nr:YceH family protein [Kiritimatiellia bacterium]